MRSIQLVRIAVLSIALTLLAGCTSAPAPSSTPHTQQNQSQAQPHVEQPHTSQAPLDFSPHAPENLADRLHEGGLVIVHRYTGAYRPGNPEPAGQEYIDDGQRISPESMHKMIKLRDAYTQLDIPLGDIVTSEYYFVWQHARAATPETKELHINRDLTGSLNFDNPAELNASLAGLRDRTKTPPPPGTNTILWTHQGKFDKAFGFYPEAGWIIIFEPDGAGNTRILASMSLDDFLALKPTQS